MFQVLTSAMSLRATLLTPFSLPQAWGKGLLFSPGLSWSVSFDLSTFTDYPVWCLPNAIDFIRHSQTNFLTT